MNEEVAIQLSGQHGLFYIDSSGIRQAYMTFDWVRPLTIAIVHTEVNEGNSGKGFGRKLVAKAVDYARENKIRIIPLCPFAKAVFDKTAEFQDVL